MLRSCSRDIRNIQEKEREGLETVHTNLGGNAVVPEGGSFLEPPSISKVPGEETSRKQMDQVPCIEEKNEKQVQIDEGFEVTEDGATKENAVVDETKQIAETDKQVDDVTGIILQMDKIEEACLNIGEEEKQVKHVEAIENREDEVEGKPKSTEKKIGGPKKYEEGERKIEGRVEVETSKEVSSFEPNLSQGKEALSQTPDATVNNSDNPATVVEVCQVNESKDSGTGDQTRNIDEQQIGEERNEGVEEKSGSCSRFLDEKDTDVVKAIEKIENEKEGTTCNTTGEGTYIVEAGIDIWKETEEIPEIGEDAHGKQNTDDIATVAHKTQEKQTEEMYSQQIDKMVSEMESEGVVNKSPQEECQNVILEKTAEAGSREGENIEDEMNPEQKLDGLLTKHESKHSIPEDLAMAEESTEESRDMESSTVIAVETNTSDSVPVTITPAQDHYAIADEEKITDVVVNTAPEHSKEETSKYKDKIEENFAQKDEAENEKIENSLTLISGEINTATSSECSEDITSSKEDKPIKIPGKSFEDKKEETPIDAEAVVDKGLPIEKGLPPTDLNEKIEDAGLELQNKNSSELHISHSLEQETMTVQGEKQPKVSDLEPQGKDHEANGPSKDLEKQIEVASETCVSMQNTNLEHPSAEGAITTEVSSKASEMAVEKHKKVHELKSEEKLEIDDAETNLEEEMQKMEAHDEQTYLMATKDTIEEVTSDKVCSREFVDRKVEHSVQAAGLQEEETPLKGVDENYEISNIVNEEVIDEPNIKDIGKVIDEDDATHLSSELVFDEKMVESSRDNETELEMSKGEYVEEQMMEDNNAKVILQEYIQEASVNDFQNDGKNIEKFSREMYEVSEAPKKVETSNNDEIPDSTPQTTLLKEQEGLQTEKLTAAAEEKDEDRSSIRKEEDEDNNNLIKEVKECSEKEILKGEGVKQISPKNEPQENLEHSASMISAETEEIALKKMIQKTEEEIGEGVEDVKKEAEIGKEEGEEQVNDENNTKSNSIESIKEVPESVKKNAEEFKGEIFEAFVTDGTNESIADATYQNDGTPNAALQTSTVKEVETVQGESKDTTPAEALPEEEEHDHARGLKRVEDNSSETGLEEDLEKSDGETSKTVDAVAHETNQYKEFPNSTLETSLVEEQASLQRDNLTPAETSREEKKYEDGSSNKTDEDNEENAGETLKAEENLEQMLQCNELIENPEQSITMICAETEADAFSKKVDNHEEEIVEIPRGNAEAELLKEENTEGHVIEESNTDILSQESAVESPIKNFQYAAKNSEKSTEEMLESQTAGEDEMSQNDENYNSSLTTSLGKIDESFECGDKNITPAEASPHDEKEEHGSLDKADDGNDSNPNLIVTNEDTAREASKVEENFEQELQKIEPGEPDESSSVMAAETEASTLSDKIDDITSQEEVVTIQNIEEIKKEKKEDHGSLDKAGEGNDSNRDLFVTNQVSTREASKVEEDFEQELPKIEPGEPEESSTVMSAETEAGTLSDKIDDITSQEEVVTVQNIEETEEHGSLEKAGEGNDGNPDLIVINQISEREASKVEEDFEQELQKVEPGELEESSIVMAAENEAGTLSDKIHDITIQEEFVTIQNIEETEEHGSLDKADEGNDSNPDLTVINQIGAREASKVEEDFEQELPKIEPGEPEESSTVMAAETEASTLSDKIDDITSQEEVVTVQNIEETEEHGSLEKAGEGNDSNPDLTVINQFGGREASKVEENFEQELQKVELGEPEESKVELGEPEESSTIMAAETEAGTLSDKIDDITSQEEFVTIQNIEKIVEKEKNEEHESLDKAGEGNGSDLDLIVNNQDNRRETSKVEEDFEQESKKIEPGEPEKSSTVMAAQTEACTLSDKIGENTSQEEVVTIQNIKETIDREKKEGSEDIDVTKVKRVVMEEDLKLVAKAFDANTRVENDFEEENIASGGKEVETVEKIFGLDSIQKLEVEEKREYKEEETKNEDIKKVCGDTKLASLSVDTEKHVTTEEHASTDISPQTTGETIAEEKAKTEKEMEESVITSVDEDTEKKVPEEESATNDQSGIISRGDESGTLVEQEVHEIIQTAEEDGDIGKQGSVMMNYEVPLCSTSEENPLHKETEDESKKVKPNDEVKDSNSEFTEPFEARGSVDRQEFETLRGKQGPNNEIYIVKASEGLSQKESNKSLIEISSLESESREEILGEVQPDVNDSSSTPITGITRETSFKEAEPEDKRQIESFELAPQEKGPAIEGKERTALETVDIDAKLEDASSFVENEDHGILAASEAEELETEMHKEIPITGSEDNSKQKECSTMLPKESELMTSEGNKTINENPTTYENIETPQTPQEIEIMLKKDMPINARDASKSMDPTIESINEEVGSYQLDNLNEQKQEGIDISKSSEVRDLANQGEIYKLMSLEDEDSSNIADEALKCTEAISAERKEVILEEDNSTKKPEDTLTENVEANKAAFALEEGTNHQEQAIGTKDYGVLDEENFEVAESGKKLEGVSETETREQSSETIPDADPGKVENITEIQNKSLESAEKSYEESQEVQEKTDEKTELKFDAEGDEQETQNTDETVKDVILTEEVHEEAKKASSETLKCTKKDVNDTWELCAKSTEDERVHELTKRENQQNMEVKEDANDGDLVTVGEETTKESQEEHELKGEESLGDKRTEKDIQNEELYKEVEKASGNERTEKQMDTERIIEHLHLAAAENETIKESFLDEAGSKLHLENQIHESASGNDGRTEAANVKEEELDVEISRKKGLADLVEAIRDIHEEEETSKTTTEHIEEHVKEVEREVDEHSPNSSAPKTIEKTCSQEEGNKEQEVCGPGVECNTDMQRNGSNEFDEEEGKTPDEDSTLQHQGYEHKIKDKEYPPENNQMTEITETGAFEKTFNLITETSEEAFKSVSVVHESEVLAESEHTEIKKEEHTEVAVTDLVAAENRNEKTIDAAEVVHDKLTNEEFKEEKEDTKNYNPINLGEETTNESQQIYDLKAEKSPEDKMAKEIQNEELSNERRRDYLHQTAVENESIKESFPDKALVKNAEDMGTKLQVENQSDEKIYGYDRTEATTTTNEEFGIEISEKERLQAPAEANETTQDIHQEEKETNSTSEKPNPIEAEPQEIIERKKEAPQVLLQEPIVEATQSAEVGESEPGNATGIVDAQGLEHRAEKNIDENNIKETNESMSAKISLFDMMQRFTRKGEVGGDLTEKKEGNESKEVRGKTKSDEEMEDEEEGEHKKTDSGSDAPVMVEASRDMVDVKVANKKHHSILSGVGSKVKHSISKVKKAITGKSSHPKQHSPR